MRCAAPRLNPSHAFSASKAESEQHFLGPIFYASMPRLETMNPSNMPLATPKKPPLGVELHVIFLELIKCMLYNITELSRHTSLW